MKVSFIIPIHNEEGNVSAVIERILQFGKKRKLDLEVIPVDDRSTDGTKDVLEEIAKNLSIVKPVYRRNDSEERGNTMGKALIEGTKSASGEVVVWTMGDLADDPKTYAEIINKIQSGYDVVFGSRYMIGGSSGNLDLIKAFLSSWGTILARFIFGVPVHDITNAFRGFRKVVFDNIHLESAGFSISPEFAIKAHMKGYVLGEVPTVYTNRMKGMSHFKLYNMTKSYLLLYVQLFIKYKLHIVF